MIVSGFLTVARAQPLCLNENPTQTGIDFRADELNNYLHLDKYKVIFFGEQHNTVFDPEIKYHLITDLNRRTGLRHVFFEMSVSNAWRFNKYLQTGDTSYLKSFSSSFATSRYGNFWKKLHEYNELLPDSSGIVVHGVDFESTSVFRTLKELSPSGGEIPASLQPLMDTIDAHFSDPPLRMWDLVDNKFTLYDNTGFTKTLRYIQQQLIANNADVQKYFSSNYDVVQTIAMNDAPVEVAPKRRNKVMYAAIERAVQAQHIDRFIGFFGAMHTSYTEGSSLSNAVRRLKNIEASDIINITEFAYNLKSTNTAFRDKNFAEIVQLNGSCKATVLPASSVPGYKKRTDFVMITDITE